VSVRFKIPSKIIEDFVEQNFQYKITSKGEYRISDPFSSDTRFRLHIHPEKSTYFSYDRQTGGDFSSFMGQYLSLHSREEVISFIVKNFSITMFDFSGFSGNKIKEEVAKKIDFPENIKWFSQEENLGVLGNSAKKYLEERKISPDGLGYVFDRKSEYNERIIIPFIENDEIVYFIARSFTGSKLRYRNPVIDSSGFVFNIDKIREELVIVEGVFDALSFNSEIQIATAMLTSRISDKQVNKILEKEPRTIIFAPDNDLTGKETLEYNIKKFQSLKSPTMKIDFYIYYLPYGIKDFNELKVKTGKDFITLDECEKYEKVNFAVSEFMEKILQV